MSVREREEIQKVPWITKNNGQNGPPSCIQEGVRGWSRLTCNDAPLWRVMYAIHNYENLKYTRMLLRNAPTSAEKLLWSGLKGKQTGYKFRRQHSLGPFIVDFFCPKLRLVIEVDGATHKQAETQEKDRIKERFLAGNGFIVIRFTDEEVHGNTEHEKI